MARPYIRKSPSDPSAVNAVQETADAIAVQAIASHPAARQDRKEAVRTERRTRRGSTLDAMQNRQLDLPPGLQDDENYVYRWANDEGSRIYNLTQRGEWDVVPDQGGESAQHNSTRRPVGVSPKTGQPLEAQLLRKPRFIHQEDEADKMSAIKATEDASLRAKKMDPSDDRPESVSYAAPNNSIRKGAYVP